MHHMGRTGHTWLASHRSIHVPHWSSPWRSVHVTASMCKACAGDHKNNLRKIVNVINPQSSKSEQRVFVPEVASKDGSIEGKLWGGSAAEDRKTLDEDTVDDCENRLEEAVAQARKQAGVPMGSLGLSRADAEAAKADDEETDTEAAQPQATDRLFISN